MNCCFGKIYTSVSDTLFNISWLLCTGLMLIYWKIVIYWKYINTSSNSSKMSVLGWWIVHTIVLPVSDIFFTARITIAADLASSPVVGSSISMTDGFETSSTAIVSLFLCSKDNPFVPGLPTKSSFILSNSTVLRTSSTNFCV